MGPQLVKALDKAATTYVVGISHEANACDKDDPPSEA